ncbi:GNAT family N-acetyltransferase [Spiroplasma endosymbiont of Ammophila pubescens]|uniref:GNAT family N-acetyltransferase n=2 Tax=Spiroplasma TaxID=2132 RepID=UPI0032B18FCF
MKQKKYRQNPKIKRMFRIKGEYEATKLAQNFVRYMTNPFQDKRIRNELIDTENEIYMTDISNNDDKTYTIAISTQLDYQEDATRVKELVKDYVDNDLDFLWYTIGEQIDEKEQAFFESLGFIQNEILVGMVLDLTKWKKVKLKVDKNLKFRRVNDNKRLNDFSKILESAMGPKSWDYAFYKTLLKLNKNKNTVEIDLLYKNDLPAATGNIYFEKDIAIIDDISTHQNFRQQGLAKLMMNYLINRVYNQGYDLVGLIATSQGYNVYHKLGFRQINLYLSEYITKTKSTNLSQIATKISRGKIKHLQTMNQTAINNMINNFSCKKCNKEITDNKYLMAFKGLNDFAINNYHQNCYSFSIKDKWVILVERDDNN